MVTIPGDTEKWLGIYWLSLGLLELLSSNEVTTRILNALLYGGSTSQ